VRVLLIHPARGHSIDRLIRLPPLGLACVAGALRAAGHDVRILDAAVLPRWEPELRVALSAWRPQVVGLSAATAVVGPVLALAATVKQADPSAAVILGGVHATLFPGEVLRDPHVDYAVHGEGERTVVELLAALAGRERPERILGIAFRDNDGPRVTPPRPVVADLDELPRPAYDLLPMGRYSTPFSAAGSVTSMVTSRGCPYPCTFCDASVVHGRRYRAYSAERVVAELRDLVCEHGVREVLFKDSEFTIDRARVDRFCDLMTDGGPRVTWTCSARVDRVDALLLKKMAAAGCRVIQFGVESADPAVLVALRKGIAGDEVCEAFRSARAAGIETVANLMVGSPGETWGSIEATRRLLAQIRPNHLNVQVLVPYPGTALHSTLGGRGPVPDEEACRRRRALLRSFYLRPGRIADRVFTTSPRAWRQNAAAAAELLGIGGTY
jgi:anaerobic magnesium-protoporphyrin IX monomethyl ester cyclase